MPQPKFPLYIPSKGRAKYMITSRVLTECRVPHNIVVEPQEADEYRQSVKEKGLLTTVLELDMDFKKKYQLCDNLGLTKSTGSGPARNFIWKHAKDSGAEWHWIMDDNITAFRRLNLNEKVKVVSGTFFAVMEEFVLRFKNVAMAGPNYYMFAPARVKMNPFTMNTRIYSCNLIRNDVPFRWRGRYNEDTILSLDMLKAGWCTILFNAFLQQKMTTQTLKGGNTSELYKGGTYPKSKMLVDVHPDVSKLSWKFGRCHHHVNYGVFAKNKLIYRDGYVPPKEEVNNFGLNLFQSESPDHENQRPA